MHGLKTVRMPSEMLSGENMKPSDLQQLSKQYAFIKENDESNSAETPEQVVEKFQMLNERMYDLIKQADAIAGSMGALMTRSVFEMYGNMD